ncbi:hypothetical protein [Streptomyces sp. 147326]|uniref:hypothetical protein n=1 Tax=Streptomyces sp. 147326 TaxID=3074379 RepID=UPI0038579883
MNAEPVIDIAFIDADEGSYPAYYEEIVRRLRPGGLVVLDNVFLGGRVLDPAYQEEHHLAMRGPNDLIAADERAHLARWRADRAGSHPFWPGRLAPGRGGRAPRLGVPPDHVRGDLSRGGRAGRAPSCVGDSGPSGEGRGGAVHGAECVDVLWAPVEAM